MRIIAIHKENGKITSYKLDNNRIVNKKRCIEMVKKGKIEDCNIGISRDGEEFVRTKRNKATTGTGKKKGPVNLGDMPTF